MTSSTTYRSVFSNYVFCDNPAGVAIVAAIAAHPVERYTSHVHTTKPLWFSGTITSNSIKLIIPNHRAKHMPCGIVLPFFI